MTRTTEMRAVLARWESSGLTQKAFASREQIPVSTLQYWRRRLSKSPPPARATLSTPELAPVRIVPTTPRAARAFEVRTQAGLVVSVPPGFDVDELRRLLSALVAC